MKKIFTAICILLSLSASAVTVNDVAGTFKGTLNIGDKSYSNKEVYILPGTANNAITFVLPDVSFSSKNADLVLMDMTLNSNGTLSVGHADAYVKQISASSVSATSVSFTFSITTPALSQPTTASFNGSKVSDENYAITNGGFEGAWSNSEPLGWHSFHTATGSYAGTADNTTQFTQATDVRPGSTGSHSALIQSKYMVVAKANGNCTNGQINAGSMTATDADGNYNFSDPSNNGYNTKFVGNPDSIIFWAKYIPADKNPSNSVNKARMHTVITTNARYQDPEASNYSSVKVAEATINYSATSSMGWQRLSVPFIYSSLDPKNAALVLVTFTTNQAAGAGTTGRGKVDNVYLDDVEMVYNHSLTSLKMNGSTISFQNGQAKTTQIFSDKDYTFAATSNGKAAKTFIGYDATNYRVYIYVVANNYSQAHTYSLYTLQMAEPIKDTEYAYSATTCDNEPYSDNLFQNLTKSGEYKTTIPNTQGGDSLITLTLTVNKTYAFPADATMKMNETYTWREKTYQNLTPGVYTFADSLKTKTGCDSVYTLTLTVQSISYLFEESATVCRNEESEWHQKTLNTSKAGTFMIYDSLKSVYGQDSVYRLTLTVLPTYTIPAEATMKMNETHIWREKTYQNLTPGVYTFTDSLKTQAGCDSVYTLVLTVQSIGYWFEETMSSCVNEETEWHGKQLPTATAGDYVLYDSLKSVYGQDSVYRLTLSVHPVYLFTEEKYVNETNLVWRGKTITDLPKREEPYLIYDSLTSQYGCDSLYLLTLHVSEIPITYGSYTNECCEGEFILFDGVEYRESFDDDVRVSEKNIYGGDSIVHVTITVFPSYYIEEELKIVVGTDTQWEYYELSQFPVGSTTLKAEFWSDDFCDSIRVLHLTVEPKPILTGVPNTLSDKQVARKVLYNGRIYIIRKDENVYDVLGNKIQ